MSDHEYLLIGGPLDGKRRTVVGAPVTVLFESADNYEKYGLHTVYPSGRNSVSVYVHADIPIRQRGAVVALRLINGYKSMDLTKKALERRERSVTEHHFSDLPTEFPVPDPNLTPWLPGFAPAEAL